MLDEVKKSRRFSKSQTETKNFEIPKTQEKHYCRTLSGKYMLSINARDGSK